jgi:hypothetical protein
VRLLADRIKPLVAGDSPSVADAAAQREALEEHRPVVYRIIPTERTGRYDKRS